MLSIYCVKLASKRATSALRYSVILSLPNLLAPDFTEFFFMILKPAIVTIFPILINCWLLSPSFITLKCCFWFLDQYRIKTHKRIMNRMNVSRSTFPPLVLLLKLFKME